MRMPWGALALVAGVAACSARSEEAADETRRVATDTIVETRQVVDTMLVQTDTTIVADTTVTVDTSIVVDTTVAADTTKINGEAE